MTLRNLLDTNVISESSRPAPHQGLMARLARDGAAKLQRGSFIGALAGCVRLAGRPM